MKVKSESEVTQSYPTLRDPMDCSPPGSSVHGIHSPIQNKFLNFLTQFFSSLSFLLLHLFAWSVSDIQVRKAFQMLFLELLPQGIGSTIIETKEGRNLPD